MDTLMITVGLPGSGKTTFSRERAEEDSSVKHVELDEFLHDPYTYESIKDPREKMRAILLEESKLSRGQTTLILDGLFLNLEDVVRLLTSLPHLPNQKLEIHQWEEDRESCLWNDDSRRDEDAKITIQHATYTPFTSDELQKALEDIQERHGFDIEVISHVVERKENWRAFISEYDVQVNEEGYLCSPTWRIGGEWWSYTGAGDVYETQPDPHSFTAMDDLLSSLSKSLTYSQYMEISKECVQTVDKEIKDYYSYEIVRYFRCDIEKLYELLERYDAV